LAAKIQEDRRSGWLGLVRRLVSALELAEHFSASSRNEDQISTPAETPEGSPYEAALDQLRFAFAAEEENARRHQDVTRMIVSATVILLGVGLFRFGLAALGDRFATDPDWMGTVVRALLIAGLACLFVATSALVGPVGRRVQKRLDGLAKKRRIVSASVQLTPREEMAEELPNPQPGSAEYVRYHSFLATLNATAELLQRNSRRDAAIYRSRVWFLWGLAFVLLAVTLYVAW
jgi:hypothetical protein